MTTHPSIERTSRQGVLRHFAGYIKLACLDFFHYRTFGEIHMRYLIALTSCFLLITPQAHACLGYSLSDTLFFEAIPSPQPDADVIAKVSLSDVDVEMRTATAMATATVLQVLKTSDARVKQGEKIVMKYEFSSCGPDHRKGEEGTIIAKTGTDSKGLLVLYPYMRRRGDDRITPPFMTKSRICGELKEQATDFCTLER